MAGGRRLKAFFSRSDSSYCSRRIYHHCFYVLLSWPLQIHDRLLGGASGGGDGGGIVHFYLVGLFSNEMVENVHRHGEDDGGVVLGGYAAQRLEVAELQEKK